MSSATFLNDEDRDRLIEIRIAIASGAYQINPHNVATKLILSMLEFDDDLSVLEVDDDPSMSEFDDDRSMSVKIAEAEVKRRQRDN
jgi:hypothetical protein